MDMEPNSCAHRYTYTVVVTFDMGMTPGRGTHEFKARNVEEARQYLMENTGTDFSLTKRNVQFSHDTLTQIV